MFSAFKEEKWNVVGKIQLWHIKAFVSSYRISIFNVKTFVKTCYNYFNISKFRTF